MHLCYMDESGTSAVPGNSSQFVLVGIALPIEFWKEADSRISAIMANYRLAHGAELHTAWVMRPYLEQNQISNFEKLSDVDRARQVTMARNTHLLSLQRAGNNKRYRQAKKNYEKTNEYIHLTFDERKAFVEAVAEEVSTWTNAKLFFECIDKIYQDASKTGRSIDEQAFEQVISRFEQYLRRIWNETGIKSYGLLVHDNNETMALKHTNLMRSFHTNGTLWHKINHIIETPLFVDSRLTSMVQIADLCSYAIRRYIENDETFLFDKIFKLADVSGKFVVGGRHFTNYKCKCSICASHRQPRYHKKSKKLFP